MSGVEQKRAERRDITRVLTRQKSHYDENYQNSVTKLTRESILPCLRLWQLKNEMLEAVLLKS